MSMQPHFFNDYATLDPFLPDEEAHSLVRLCEEFGSYGLYSEEGLNDGIGEGLPQRFDAAFNFIKTGGRFGRSREDLAILAGRTNYFRETYAYGDSITAPGIESLYYSESLMEHARRIFRRPTIEPAIVYANILLPGQELALHTDVPEFRGMSRKLYPQWLLVVMHHSGLFEESRLHIATAVSWYQDTRGGEFAFYPDGADAPGTALTVNFNSAIIADTDSLFHGVDRVEESLEPMPPFRPGMRVHPDGDGLWIVRDGETEIARYNWDEMRFSISWKAYCFNNEDERKRWHSHSEDLKLDSVLDRLCDDLQKRGRISDTRPENRELAEILVDEYIHFPPPEADPA
ncbi:MAG: hypothetical protein ACJZ7Z_11020 [Myxococcota bacterium]